MKCNHNIPQARLDLGYKVCVECSTEEKLGCIDTIHHKTGNTIQVMSRKDADQASKLTKRAGFGILRSMAGGSTSQRKAKIINGGKTYMDYLEVDKEIAQRFLDRALNNLEISENQYNKIKLICYRLNTITTR